MTGVSGTLLDGYAVEFFSQIKPLHRVLDIGAGRGKYLKLLRMMGRNNTHVTAIEIESNYVDQFHLRDLYNEVLVADAAGLIELDTQYDLIIAGDVLEHMRKSAGVDLLHWMVYHARYLWLQWPLRYVQNALDGYRHERHISVWTEADVLALNADYVRFFSAPLEAYAVLGYLGASPEPLTILRRSEPSLNV